jgi:hypothetical protein
MVKANAGNWFWLMYYQTLSNASVVFSILQYIRDHQTNDISSGRWKCVIIKKWFFS